MRFIVAILSILFVFVASDQIRAAEAQGDHLPAPKSPEPGDHLPKSPQGPPSPTETPVVEVVTGLPKSDTDTDEVVQRWHTTIEIGLSVSVLAFGAFLIAMEVFYLRSRPDIHPAWMLKLLGLTLVVTAGLFLIVAGFTQSQTASMMGLLGTAAGYLLGKEAIETVSLTGSAK